MSTLTRKMALAHDFSQILMEKETRDIKMLISKYQSGKLTPEEALIGIGVLAGMRSLLLKIDHQVIEATPDAR